MILNIYKLRNELFDICVFNVNLEQRFLSIENSRDLINTFKLHFLIKILKTKFNSLYNEVLFSNRNRKLWQGSLL